MKKYVGMMEHMKYITECSPLTIRKALKGKLTTTLRIEIVRIAEELKETIKHKGLRNTDLDELRDKFKQRIKKDGMVFIRK